MFYQSKCLVCPVCIAEPCHHVRISYSPCQKDRRPMRIILNICIIFSLLITFCPWKKQNNQDKRALKGKCQCWYLWYYVIPRYTHARIWQYTVQCSYMYLHSLICLCLYCGLHIFGYHAMYSLYCLRRKKKKYYL